MFPSSSPPLFLHLSQVDSTNDWVKRNFKGLSYNDLTCVSAKSQSSGKGKFSRPWISPSEGNIYASFHFISPQKNLENLSQIAGLSLCQTLKTLNFNPKFKWPNDTLIDNKKVAGILCETFTNSSHLHVIIGVGINVNMSLGSLKQVSQATTSLKIESQKEWNEKNILKSFAYTLQDKLNIYLTKGFSHFLDELNQFLAYTGRKITLRFNGRIYKGVFKGVDYKGFLNLIVDENGEKKLYSFASCEEFSIGEIKCKV